ncbi:MAG: hypothetical protein HKL95_00620 [Phycisphaerae bacterium]|nr:hypothetical protein [Phycisphaerae bacterium]
MKTRFALVFGLAFALTLAGCSKSPKGKSASTANSSGNSNGAALTVGSAETALTHIVQKIRSGDVSQIESSFVASTPVEKKLVAAVAKMESLKTTVVQVAEQKLGGQSSEIGSLVAKIAPTSGLVPTTASEKSPLVIEGENAIVKQGDNMASVYLKQYAGNWKIDLQKTVSSLYPDAATAESKLGSLTTALAKATNFLGQVQTGLKNGSIKSLSDVEKLAGQFEVGSVPGVNNAKNMLHF